jgi:hypothetical protein
LDEQLHADDDAVLASKHGHVTYHRLGKNHPIHGQVRDQGQMHHDQDNLDNGSTVRTVLKQAMKKLVSEPMLQKQETCHHIASNNPTI